MWALSELRCFFSQDMVSLPSLSPLPCPLCGSCSFPVPREAPAPLGQTTLWRARWGDNLPPTDPAPPQSSACRPAPSFSKNAGSDRGAAGCSRDGTRCSVLVSVCHVVPSGSVLRAGMGTRPPPVARALGRGSMAVRATSLARAHHVPRHPNDFVVASRYERQSSWGKRLAIPSSSYTSQRHWFLASI